MFFDGGGEAVDWILGYDPPAAAFKAKLDKILKGEGTYKSLLAAYAKNPKAIDTVFNLGRKYEDRYDQAKATEFYKKVVALDPMGKKGTTVYETGEPGVAEKVTYTQYAEFSLSAAALSARPADPAPMLAFLKRYPNGEMVKAGYMRLGAVHFLRTAPKDQAAAFFAEYTDRFPADSQALSMWVQRILMDKEPVDKGIELAAKAIALNKMEAEAAAKSGAVPAMAMMGLSVELNLARLYALKGDKNKAIAVIDEGAKAAAENPRMISSYAQAYLDVGAEDKALAIYGPAFLQKSLAAASSITPYASFWARQEKNLESALEAAKKAVEMNPAAFVGWTTLAQVYVKMKNAPEAIKAADKALETAPAAQRTVVQRMVDQIKSQAAAIK
jgi:tetratricopeptide (TPR) repeat protein